MLSNKKLVFGITGGIAAYKTAELLRRSQDLGARIDVVMTESATRFISPTKTPEYLAAGKPVVAHAAQQVVVPRAAAGRGPGGRGGVAVDADLPALRAQDADDGLEQGGLAGAVHPDQSGDPPGGDVGADAVQGEHVAVPHDHVGDLDGAHQPLCPVSPATMVSASCRMRSR